MSNSFGCEHYKRRCKIRAPCCNLIVSCRLCHDQAAEASSDHHSLVRKDVKQVICSLCDTEQEVAQFCSKCGVCMGEYFCDICKLFDDDTSKEQFHCYDCGVCRVGGRDKFFHCDTCGACYAMGLLENHSCFENSTKIGCPICFEVIFDSVKAAQVLKCGHTIHVDCFEQMIGRKLYRCPFCTKAMLDMSNSWQSLDDKISAAEINADLQRQVDIICRDCNQESHAMYHPFGLKCSHCGSYNTSKT